MRLDGDRTGTAAAPPGEVAGRALVREPNPHRHRGVALSDCVEDFARLAPEDTLLVNPRDAAELGVGDGDSRALTTGGPAYRVRLDRKVPSALLYLLASPQNASSV
jgi:predicted molibdopterin-dependent oxidoreductase YjgC